MRIFIALPYSGTEEQRERRFSLARDHAIALVKEGHVPMSSIVMFHQTYVDLNDVVPYETWISLSIAYLKGCDRIHIITEEGWLESVGVGLEMRAAVSARTPVFLVPVDLVSIGAAMYGLETFNPSSHPKI